MSHMLPLAVLVTTVDRQRLHSSRTIPSLVGQTVTWDGLFVVDDSCLPEVDVKATFSAASLSGMTYTRNLRKKGAAGSWNTGIKMISQKWPDAWVAILDDDDVWDSTHLEICRANERSGADAIISGIATYGNESYAHIDLNEKLPRRSFLWGNPGWQGSNTYVRLSRLIEVGGFDENLECTHDRDLALRLMALPGFELVRTGRRTVWYMMDEEVPAYTRVGNPQKLKGLKGFLRKYLNEMTNEDVALFKSRAEKYFGFPPCLFDEIS